MTVTYIWKIKSTLQITDSVLLNGRSKKQFSIKNRWCKNRVLLSMPFYIGIKTECTVTDVSEL